MSGKDLGRVLSIQSHVSFGYVGGKAAVFPLQVLGYDVDVVNTVNFSNHSGYGRFGGTRTNAEELTTLFEAMERNGFLRPSRLLTGYIPGAEALSAAADLARKLREQNPDLIYLLDPVLGDAGKLYVAADVVPIYRSLLHCATIITPNWFEVEVLTETTIHDKVSLRHALKILHETYAVPNVVVSSIPLRPWLLELLPAHLRPIDSEDIEHLLCLASSCATQTVHVTCVPLIPGYFSGVGDLFSALVLAHFQGAPLADVVASALTKTHAILLRTHAYALSLPADERTSTDDELDTKDPERRIRRMRGRELRLIQAQDIIRGDGIGELRKLREWENFWSLE